MKKVGIITFNFALNYGSLLQCYALQNTLESLGNRAYIVKLNENNEESHIGTGKAVRNWLISLASHFDFIKIIRERNIKVRKFIGFAEERFNYTDGCNSIEDLSRICNNLDALISGSDQVWNNRLQDFTELFFLPVEGVGKIGYSISTGPVEEEELQAYQELIKAFDNISVREMKTKKIVSSLWGQQPVVTCDPVFLTDKVLWDKLASTSEYDISEPYILVFLFGKNREYFDRKYEIVEKIAKNRNLNVVYLNHGYYKHSFKKNAICDAGIEDFIKLLKGADVVLTDSFHGTAFSLIYEKDLYTCVVSNNSDRRKQELLLSVGASHRLIEIDKMNYIINHNPIDYSVVRKSICKMKDESLDYLMGALR